ncbi:DUF6118 family protein [Sphingomonas sp. TREG-RG-20F-R18-01]|uniref:DUF6118 family protein n=1 Tax=Sphingomonas sp. TREG-RG-20F-R18-01 TaxID=2914982 RepID=UPI001F56B719|nr:DUF6118 family protein [Sphingomonas sp. TREG-RG-20F-R18-01]
MTDDQPEFAAVEDIIRALEALRSEGSLTRLAVEGLTAARERIPDYSPTLGQISQDLKVATGGIGQILESPALRLSPAILAVEMVKASTEVRAEDRKLLADARDALSRSIGRIDAIVERGQAVNAQWRQLGWAATAGAIVGILMMAVLPGAVARSLPASWHVPEWMAARTIGLDQRRAGERMIMTAPSSRPAQQY